MHVTYAEAGVDAAKEDVALGQLLKYVKKSLEFRKGIGSTKLDIGYFANVIDIGKVGLAVSIDGVGTKILIAQMMNKYDTIGIDCIAMNVNDILCVGAEPISFFDYIGVKVPNPKLIGEIGKGLLKGAEIAGITLPGGEIAQLKDMLKGRRKNYEFDLIGVGLGIVPLDKIITGENIKENDVVVGLRSSGIHSNGLTLARHVFFNKIKASQYFPELGRRIGEELLEPTVIYAPQIMKMINSGLDLKALVHITGDGFLNLTRIKARMGFVIDSLPEPQPIFSLIQKFGNISDEEMFRVFNMGIGFCVILPEKDSQEAIEISKKNGVDAFKIGKVKKDPKKRVLIKHKKIILKGK
jgi:phosphoribosylformylglycinamidine cyclo-ligase